MIFGCAFTLGFIQLIYKAPNKELPNVKPVFKFPNCRPRRVRNV